MEGIENGPDYISGRLGDKSGSVLWGQRWNQDLIPKISANVFNHVLGVPLSSKKQINFNSPLSDLSNLSLTFSLCLPLPLFPLSYYKTFVFQEFTPKLCKVTCESEEGNRKFRYYQPLIQRCNIHPKLWSGNNWMWRYHCQCMYFNTVWHMLAVVSGYNPLCSSKCSTVLLDIYCTRRSQWNRTGIVRTIQSWWKVKYNNYLSGCFCPQDKTLVLCSCDAGLLSLERNKGTCFKNASNITATRQRWPGAKHIKHSMSGPHTRAGLLLVLIFKHPSMCYYRSETHKQLLGGFWGQIF